MALRTLLVSTAVVALAIPGAVAQQPAIVFRGVTVVPMNGRPPLADATVVVEVGRIRAVGPARSTPVPRGARVVDGRGRWLIPGLWDAHVHLSKTRASAMGLFLANGVTSVRDAGGDHEELLRWRREVNAGRRAGPRIIMAGPYLEAAERVARQRRDPVEERAEPVERTRVPIGSPEDARRVVDSVAALEVDFLKIRTAASRETYFAIGEAARRAGRRLTGHAVSVTPEDLIRAGHVLVDHPILPPLDRLTPDQRRDGFAAMARAGHAIVPTLVTWFVSLATPDSIARAVLDDSLGRLEPRRRYLSRFLVMDWREQVAEREPGQLERLRTLFAGAFRDLREMQAAGIPFLAGSDVAVLLIFPGSTPHDELALLVCELGFTPEEALASATRRPAEFFGLSDSLGTIEPGKLADLVLLDADPLADIANTRRIGGVMARGRWFDRPALGVLLEEVERAEDRRVNDWPRTPSR